MFCQGPVQCFSAEGHKKQCIGWLDGCEEGGGDCSSFVAGSFVIRIQFNPDIISKVHGFAACCLVASVAATTQGWAGGAGKQLDTAGGKVHWLQTLWASLIWKTEPKDCLERSGPGPGLSLYL